MALTRLDNLYSSKTGKYLYVSPDDFNATDELDNRGNSPLRPFKTIQRAFIEVARYSYLPGKDNDRFDQFSIMLMPGDHYIDNRPGLIDIDNSDRQRYFDAQNLINLNRQEIIDRAYAQIAIDYNEGLWGTDWVVPGDEITDAKSRFKDAYRLIQKNRTEIINSAYSYMQSQGLPNPAPNNLESKCKRDIGYFVDAISLDVSLGEGNVYTRKFLQNYFISSGLSFLGNTLQGEEIQSATAFTAAADKMKQAITNQLTYKDLTITPDPLTNNNVSSVSCSNVRTFIDNLTEIVTDIIISGNLEDLPAEVVASVGAGEEKCKRDIGYIVDAVSGDLANGGNANILAATKSYFNANGTPINNGLVGEEAQSVVAFNAAADMMKKAVTNQLYKKDLTIAEGPAYFGQETSLIENLPSGNAAACVDVQNTIDTLIGIITETIEAGNLDNLAAVEVTGDVPVFNYNRALQEWQDTSILDLSNPDNVLYKFNATTGGCIVPRGCSLIGYDLRRTIVRPLYVPDPADGTQGRTSIFNLTGGCYLWQFTIKDGDLTSNSPLFDSVDNVGKVYFQKGNNTSLAIPEYSHHKICIMEYADLEELDLFYRKVATSFTLYQPSIDDGDFEALPQENRIVGPLSDTRSIVNIKLKASTDPEKTIIRVTTKIAHGYFKDQYIAIIDNGLNDLLNGTFKVSAIDNTDPKVFEYEVKATTAQLDLEINEEGYGISSTPDLSVSARSQAEIDSVESASPYVFNCSIRSTWGLCGMWADGAKSTGFRSMVVAQYTGVSLQKDDRAFIRYDEFSNTWNQASLTDAFATVPYHTKGDAYWKDDWRNFHIRASNDAFIQCVSVFAVGFHDHFLMESGGDMSITNSNSNFGNTSLHATGFKGFAFNQDKGGYITDIVTVKEIDDSAFNEEDQKYYSLALQPTKGSETAENETKLYYGADNVYDPFTKPTTSINGYRLGAKSNEKIYLKLKSATGEISTFYNTVEPSGFVKYKVSVETLNPDGVLIDNIAQDAANIIETNKLFIQQEAYGYITAKYPNLLTNTNITISKCERDIGYFVDAVVQDLRLGGNINTIQAAEGYYVGGQLAYIQNELNESIETYDYVKNLCISAMRNFDYLVRNCTTTSGSPIIDIGDTTGIIIGMKVTHYDYNTTNFTNGKLNSNAVSVNNTVGGNPVIPANAYVKRIVDSSRIEIGVQGSKLTSGLTLNALLPSTSAYLYFELPQTVSTQDSSSNLSGVWASTPAIRDNTLVQDNSAWTGNSNGYPECSGVATSIIGYFTNINLILNQGLTPVANRNIDASNLILANKQLIAQEAVYRMLNDNTVGTPAGFPGVPGGNQNCIDDILDVLDEIAFNVKYGGNNRVYDAAAIYVSQPSLLTGERNQAVFAFNAARDMAIQAMRNESITITGNHGLTQVVDNTITGDQSGLAGDYNPGDCADVATTITTLFGIITGAIGTEADPGDLVGIVKTTPEFTNIERVEPSLDTSALSARATLFTVNTGGSTSNPHNFETGTPVRLVPKAREGTNPDKRVIRLPKGFDTNTIYYVIAPGRTTDPEPYNDGVKYPNKFTQNDTTKLMLAKTKDNAAAGIYIYSPETESVDPDVEIELQQYVLDEKYDLHQYFCNFESGVTDAIFTDIPHIFDVPSSSENIQKIFFRTFGDPSESTLPQISVNGISSPVETDRYYYVRYETKNSFSVYLEASHAISGTPKITFTSGYGKNFYVFADKRVSPVRFDAEASIEDSATGDTIKGIWYINTKNESDQTFNIINRIKAIGSSLKDSRSKNTFFKRLKDERSAADRLYRLRYVIPKYAEGVRDPLNGFVIKARTDETRRLLPQKIVLKKVGSLGNDVAQFTIQVPLSTGGTSTYTLGETVDNLPLAVKNYEYDPYDTNKVKVIDSDKTSSKVSFSIQSARKVDVEGTELLELTVFDHGITNSSLKNDKFTTLKINAPQGGTFRVNTTSNTTLNEIRWSGNSSGLGYLQGYFNVPGTDEHYLIIKNIENDTTIKYNSLVDTVFYQNVLDVDNLPVYEDGEPVLIYATLQAKPNSVGSSGNILSKSEKNDYLYSNKEANVLTVTPGDIIEDDTTTQYRVISVEDAGEITDTFYIFKVDTIQRRIPNQQEGIYYLTCLKGNISPYPTGAGVGQNFRNYKFSQPISQLYPLNYKNDPLWFQVRDDGTRDSSIKDVPATICAADNYVHGLVTTNDAKNSETKEVVIDLTQNPALSRYDYVNNKIDALPGNASAGSEDRNIPICGDSEFPTEKKLYVELRRPSIARSGNHTFEYLGFGPGNYSTGFPLRQEVVLSDKQDFYAQSKKEDGGIVFYTGLNSNGDLYIGNRKINAITGEETYLERAVLLESDDEEGDLGGLVTTFELPVVFEKEITVDGDAFFNNPVTITVDADEDNSLVITSTVSSQNGEDPSLDSQSFLFSSIFSKGNITLHKNRIYSAIYALNPRGNNILSGQNYSIRTHADNGNSYLPTNHTPNQENTSLGFIVNYGSESPISGDILLKGKEVGKSGSLGWIYSNYFTNISDSINSVEALGNVTVRFYMKSAVTTDDIGLFAGSQLRLSNFTEDRFNELDGLRTVVSVASDKSSFTLNAPTAITTSVDDPFVLINEVIEISNNSWKEVGLIGSEALRTNTDYIGDYKLGINTVARAKHGTNGDQLNGFVSDATNPRANLDIVGTAFISGKTLEANETTNNFVSNPLLSNRTFNTQKNAFLVGGISDSPDSLSTLRVSTSNNGRFGINTTAPGSGLSSELNRTLVVIGDARITDDLKLENDLDINGGNLRTSSSFFNIFDGSGTTEINAFSYAQTLNISNLAIGTQEITIGSAPNKQVVNIGRFADETELYIHDNSKKSLVRIGYTDNDSTSYSVIQIGGAFDLNSDSITEGSYGSVFKVRNRYTQLDGNLRIGTGFTFGTNKASIQSNTLEVDAFTTTTTKLNFATAASSLNIGAPGGYTTINNNLIVKTNTTLEGDVTMAGGLNTGQFVVDRGSFSVATTSHSKGSDENTNIDIFKKTTINRTIDATGLEVWGGTEWKVTQSNNEDYYLPIGEVSDETEFEVGAYLLIDRSVQVSGQDTTVSPVGEQYSELLLITEVTNLNDVGEEYLRVKVKRARNFITESGNMVSGNAPTASGQVGYTQSGYKYLRTDHPDNAKLIRYDLSTDVSYINNANGLLNSDTDTTISTGPFSGNVIVGDIFRFGADINGRQGELAQVTAINTTSAQKFKVTDGGNPAVDLFTVNSTNGDVEILGNLTVHKNINLKGSTTEDQERLRILDGNAVEKFVVDSATGKTYINSNLAIGGSTYNKFTVNVESSTTSTSVAPSTVQINTLNLEILGTGGSTDQKLYLQNSTGNLTIKGVIKTDGTGVNTMAGDLKINGGELTVNQIVSSVEKELFKVRYVAPTSLPSGGAINFAGQEGFFTQTGARKWTYVSAGDEVIQVTSNVSYFVAPSTDLAILLPANPITGDMIRVVDVGGNLTYNVSLRFVAPNGIRIQGDNTNSGVMAEKISAIVDDDYATGGELVVQTPNAGLGLIYLGASNYDGTGTSAPSTQQGWWLVEI